MGAVRLPPGDCTRQLNEDLFFRQVCKQHRVNVTETLHTVNLHCPGPVGHRTGITHGFEYGLTENTRISAEFLRFLRNAVK